MHHALHTRFCDLAGVERPIVQTGMGWVSGARLTAATSAAGGLGILAAVTMTPSQIEDAVRDVKARTDKPFGVNFRADQPDLRDRLAFVIAEGVRVVSFAGAPTKDAIERLHGAGALCIPTVGARRHAEKMLEWGVDAVIAQGGEGGGHTGTVPTSLLLPQVVDAVGASIPVLGAGGFHDGRGLVAALGVRRGRHRDGNALPAHAGESGTRQRQGSLRRGVRVRHGGHDLDRRGTTTGHPHRCRGSHRTILDQRRASHAHSPPRCAFARRPERRTGICSPRVSP